MNNTNTTAAQAYAEKIRLIGIQLAQIQACMKTHNDKFVHQENSKNWGFVGDLGNVETKLEHALNFLK